MGEFRYDAFISYRHGGVDQYVAEQIHKRLETFKLPANVLREKKKNGEKTKIERVFRDQEELPLSDNLEDAIVKALENSDNLIVVCTPRFQESLWCQKEVETFIKLHGRKHVYAVLVEGEPKDSFPELLTVGENGEQVEPLAADFRALNRKELNRKMNVEILRLVAPIFNLNFDELRQRHRERKAKAAFRVSLLVATISLAFAGVCGFSALYMAKQNELILDQNNEIIAKNSEISSQNEIIETSNEKLLNNQALALAKDSNDLMESGDRFGAIEKAYQSLTEYEGDKLPYTAEGQRALTTSLMCYDSGYYYSPKYLMNTYGSVLDTKVSPDRKYMMVIDISNSIIVYEVDSLSKVYEDHNIKTGITSLTDSSFIDETTICYFNEDGRFIIVDLQNGTEYVSDEIFDGVGKVYSSQRKYIAVGTSSYTTIYDATDMTEIITCNRTDDSYGLILDDVIFDTYSNICMVNFTNYFDGYSESYIYDLSTGEMLNSDTGNMSKIKGSVIDEEYIYIVYSNYDSANANYYVKCIDKSDYSTKWIEKSYNADTADISLVNDVLVINNKKSVSFIDANTGESIGIEIFDNCCLCTRSNNNYAYFYFDDGTYTYYDCEKRELSAFIMPYMKDTGLIELKVCANGFIGFKGNTLGVTYYSKLEPVSYTPIDYEDDYQGVQNDTLDDEAASNEAKALGIENYYIAYRITYSPNYNIAIINYSDRSIDVFDLKKKTVIDHVENVNGVNHSDGLDAYGNEYFKMGYGGIAINSDGKVISVFDDYVGLSEDGKSVIILGKFGDYTYAYYPIYSIDELTNMAEVILETYSH